MGRRADQLGHLQLRISGVSPATVTHRLTNYFYDYEIIKDEKSLHDKTKF